jgi:hypothetical protein
LASTKRGGASEFGWFTNWKHCRIDMVHLLWHLNNKIKKNMQLCFFATSPTPYYEVLVDRCPFVLLLEPLYIVVLQI